MPRIGINDIKFGMSFDEMNKHIRVPDEINELDQFDVWEYYEEGLSLFFEKKDRILTQIEIEERDVKVWDEQLMFKSPDYVRNVLENNTNAKIEIIDKPAPSLFFNVESLGLVFYFEDSKLTTITARRSG